MDSIHLLHQLCDSQCPAECLDSLSVLGALLAGQERVDDRWHRLLRGLPGASPAELLDQVLEVDRELGQYRRAITFLRANLSARRAAMASGESVRVPQNSLS